MLEIISPCLYYAVMDYKLSFHLTCMIKLYTNKKLTYLEKNQDISLQCYIHLKMEILGMVIIG